MSDRNALIRSEERLEVTTVRVPSRRVRLEKYVVTETRTITVQISREEVRLVEIDLEPAESPTEGGPVPVVGTADAVDPGRWLTLSEEQIVVTTTVVPVERVRLDITSITEDRTITEDVRRERIAFAPDSYLPGVPSAGTGQRGIGGPPGRSV